MVNSEELISATEYMTL